MSNSTKKENRPPCPATVRQRFRKIPPGVYENAETGKVIIIISESEYYLGHIRIRKGLYKYASWRQGKQVKEKYLKLSGQSPSKNIIAVLNRKMQ